MKWKAKLSLILPIIAVLISAAILVLFFIFKKDQLIELPLTNLPGYDSSIEDKDPDLLAPGLLKHLEDNMLIDVEILAATSDGKEEIIKVDDLLFAWRKLPDIDLGDDEDDIFIAAEILARDQIYLGQVLLETGKSKQYRKWQNNFERAFLDPETSLCYYSLEQREDGSYTQIKGDWSVSQEYLRLLVFDYGQKANQAKFKKIENLAALLLPIYEQGPPANLKGLGPDLNHPLFSTAEEIPFTDEQEEIELVSIESIDLWLLTQLAAIDEKWAALAADWQIKIENSISDLAMPFPAEGWNIKEDTPMPLISSDYQAQSWRFLRSSLHLAEIGRENIEICSFLNEELNSGGLAKTYHFISGEAGDRPLDPGLSARAARLGRATDDDYLFAAALKQIKRSYIANQANLFFGSFSIIESDGRLTSYALDQLLILLAIN